MDLGHLVAEMFPMAEIAPYASRSLFELVLDLEEPLADLHDAVLALDLIASGSLPDGIDKHHARGLKIVTRCAREFAERLRQDWRATLTRAEADRIRSGAGPGE